jgi:hypothetical protein
VGALKLKSRSGKASFPATTPTGTNSEDVGLNDTVSSLKGLSSCDVLLAVEPKPVCCWVGFEV